MTASAAVAGLLVAGFVSGVRAQTVLPPELPGYAVLGVEDVTIRRKSSVLSGAVGSIGGTVRLGPDVRVATLAASTVRLGTGVRTGRVFCHFVSGPPTLPLCNGFADPLVDRALLTAVPVVPGLDDLRLRPHTGTAPIPAGGFRDVRIGPGSVLQLSGGAYAMRSLRIGRAGRVACTAECRIGVVEPVRLRRAAVLGASSPIRAATVRIDISASGLVPAFLARARANVSASIFAPAGDVILGALGSYRGAIVGRTVTVGPRVTVRGDSAL